MHSREEDLEGGEAVAVCVRRASRQEVADSDAEEPRTRCDHERAAEGLVRVCGERLQRLYIYIYIYSL